MLTVPDSVSTFLDRFTVGWVVRKTITAAAIVLPIWTWGGPYISTMINARADDAIVKTMKAHGIDPETFKTSKRKFPMPSNRQRQTRLSRPLSKATSRR